MSQFIVIDVGGTAIKYGILDSDTEEFIIRKETDTQAYLGGPSLTEKIAGLASQLAEFYPAKGVCISTAGMVDPQTGVIVYASDAIPGYTGCRIKEKVEQATGLPVSVENDVNCAGLAESVSGTAKDSSFALVLTIGTGIGGCFIHDGKVYHGADNAACEVGYLPLNDSDFQTIASTTALVSNVASAKNEAASEWSGRRIFEQIGKGDAVCIEETERLCDILGKGIAAITYVLNPDTIVLGGGIMSQKEWMQPRIEKAMKKYLVPYLKDKVRLEMASHKNDAGMKGAYYHFLQQHPDAAQ